MSSQQLTTLQYLSEPADPETSPLSQVPKPPQVPASKGPMLIGAALFMFMVIAAIWLCLPGNDSKSPRAANLFLWLAGSDLTWDQYQEQQRKEGNGRLDEKEYDWTQQALNDAYSRSP